MILAIDTATSYLGLALHNGQRLLADISLEAGNQHSRILPHWVSHMLSVTGIRFDDIDLVAVSIGPGSYTGLRVGLAFAKGFTQPKALPLLGVSTLEIMAAGQQTNTRQTLLTIIQAGRSRINYQSFRTKKGDWLAVDEPQNTSLEELIETIDTPSLITGELDASALESLNNAIQAGKPITIVEPAFRLRRASILADIAWQHYQAADDKTIFTKKIIQPIYLSSQEV